MAKFEMYLHGFLAETYGSQKFSLNATSVRGAVQLLAANLGDRFTLILRQGKWKLYTDIKHPFSAIDLELVTAKPIHIMPLIEGSGDDANDHKSLTGGLILFFSGGASIPFDLIGGLIMPEAESPVATPEIADYTEAEIGKKPSFLYNGVVNTVEQGVPVPLVYGEHLVGSIVISASVSLQDVSGSYTPIRDNFSFSDGLVKDWLPYGTGTTLAVVDKKLVVTTIDTTDFTGAYLPVTLVQGESYKVTCGYALKSAGVDRIGLGLNDENNVLAPQHLVTDTTPVSLSTEFTLELDPVNERVLLIVDGIGTGTFDHIDLVASTGQHIEL